MTDARAHLWRLCLVLFSLSPLGCDEGAPPEDAEAIMCAQVRCDGQICALIDGAPTCICPPGTYEGADGGCLPPPDIGELQGAHTQPNDMEVSQGGEAPGGLWLEAGASGGWASGGEPSGGEPAPPLECAPDSCPVDRACEVIEGGLTCVCLDGLEEDPITGLCLQPQAPGLCPDSHLEGDGYEPNECDAEATILIPSLAQPHSVLPGGDEDWFQLNAQAGHVYRFEVERLSLPNAILYLYDAELRHIFSQSSTYEITHEMPSAGVYYYKVNGYNAQSTGDYEALLTDLGPDDHADAPGGATPITVDGEAVEGQIETRGDDDWFSFEAQAGCIYHVEVSRSTLSGAYVYLYYPDGQRIAESHSDPESITYELPSSGRWYVRVRHSSGSGSGGYSVSVSERGTDDHADELTGATTLEVNGPAVSGDIETRGDLDYFQLQASRGHVYRLSLNPLSLSGATLTIYRPDGSLERFTSSSVLIFEAEESGVWGVQVRHSSTTQVGTYELTAEQVGVDDHEDGYEGATPISLDGSLVEGEIESERDVDMFEVSLSAGVSYVLQSAGLDVRSSVYQANGVRLAWTGGERLTFTPTTSGTHFIELRADITIATGAYSFTLSE